MNNNLFNSLYFKKIGSHISERNSDVIIKSAEEIIKIRESGRLTADVLQAVRPIIQPGITTLEIDSFCHDYITNTLKAIPGSLGQYDYPHTANTSVNHVVCHGWPPCRKQTDERKRRR